MVLGLHLQMFLVETHGFMGGESRHIGGGSILISTFLVYTLEPTGVEFSMVMRLVLHPHLRPRRLRRARLLLRHQVQQNLHLPQQSQQRLQRRPPVVVVPQYRRHRRLEG